MTRRRPPRHGPPATAGAGSPRAAPLAPLLLAALVLAVFANTWGGAFVFDDHSLIEDNPNVRGPAGLATAFTTDFYQFHGGGRGQSAYYRPLASASYVVDYALWGTRAGPYHLQNTLYHVLAALLAYQLARRLSGSRWVAWLAAALWAVHPVTSESVAWITGRTDPMAACGILGALLAHLRYRERGRVAWLALAGALTYLACLAKETAAVVPLLALALDALAPRRGRLRGMPTPAAAGLLAVPVALYLVQRFAVMGGLSPAVYPGGDWEGGLRTFLRAIVFYARTFFWPDALVGDIHVAAPGWGDGAVLGGGLLALAFAAWTAAAAWRRSPAAFGLALCALTLAPAAGVLAPIPIPVAVRYLYLPSLGLVTALLVSARGALARGPIVLRAAPAALLVVLAPLTVARNADYRSDEAFYPSVIRNADRVGLGIEPGYYSLLNHGRLRAQAGSLSEAEALTRRAIAEEPAEGLAWNNLGNILALRGELEGAVAAWRQAVTLDPAAPDPQVNLAFTLDRLGRVGEAAAAYRAALAKGVGEPQRSQAEARLRVLEGLPPADEAAPPAGGAATAPSRSPGGATR